MRVEVEKGWGLFPCLFLPTHRRVTMPVPRGRKSRPTTASRTEDLPEDWKKKKTEMDGWMKVS
jgi:hypothetical protein